MGQSWTLPSFPAVALARLHHITCTDCQHCCAYSYAASLQKSVQLPSRARPTTLKSVAPQAELACGEGSSAGTPCAGRAGRGRSRRAIRAL